MRQTLPIIKASFKSAIKVLPLNASKQFILLFSTGAAIIAASFAVGTHALSSPSAEKGEKKESIAAKSARFGSQIPNPQPKTRSKEIQRALQQTGVFVSPSLRSMADPAAIRKVLRGTQVRIKVAVVDKLPTGYSSAEQFAQILHSRLNLENRLAVVVSDQPRSVGIYGVGLEKEALQGIVGASTRTFDAEGYVAGIAQIARAVDAECSARANQRRNLILAIIVVSVGLILSVLRYKQRRDKQR